MPNKTRRGALLTCVLVGFSIGGCGTEGTASVATEPDSNEGRLPGSASPSASLTGGALENDGREAAATRASILLDVPLIMQKPELPRGCEVTALAMMLRYAGASADKMTLAQQIKKVPYMENGLHGNPYEGFVGDMYDFNKPGYGVYHGPVKRLADSYLPDQMIDLTGVAFDSLLEEQLANGRPVWVISNARFRKLAPSDFETWHTRSGDVQITWHEHSVVITGYDSSYIYINDPLDPNTGKNKRLDRQAFREAWEQMGRQAIGYLSGPPT